MGERAFLERVRREVLLGDGSPAALLDARAAGGVVELLNLQDRRQVEALHIAFIRAGARVIRTNTLGANRVRLERHGLAGRVWEINVWGAKVARTAREVAGEPVFIAGVLGPLAPARTPGNSPTRLEGPAAATPDGLPSAGAGLPAADLPENFPPDLPAQIPDEQMLAAYREQVEALLAGGVDLFLVEAVEDARQAVAAVRAVRAACHLPVAVVLSFTASGRTPAGEGVAEVLARLRDGVDRPPDLLGACGALGPGPSLDLDLALDLARRLRRAGWAGPLWVLSNAMPGDGDEDRPVSGTGSQDRPTPGAQTTAPGFPGTGSAEAAAGLPPAWARFVQSLAALGPGVVGWTGRVTPRHVASAHRILASRELPAGPRAAAAGGNSLPVTRGEPGERPSLPPSLNGSVNGTAGTSLPAAGRAATSWGSPSPAGGSPAASHPARVSLAVSHPGSGRAELAGIPCRGEQSLAAQGGPEPAPHLPGWPEAGREAGGRAMCLRDKLGRQFVVSVELDPPRGTVVHKFLDDARRLGEAGVDCINVGDSPMARVRMAAIGGAYLIQAAVGVETIVHFTTRDRNLMALQADLLAAHALGLRNILALTGDNPRLGNTTASAVYDVDSIGLLRILRELNRGRDITGNSIGEPTAFTVACALSPNAENLDRELDRFRRKLEAGVDFVMTQPLYETAPLERVLDRLGGCPVPIVMGVMPLHSARHAHYLHHEVPGISIPAHVREALEKAGERGLEVGLELAEAVVEAARPWIAGVYVVVSFGKVEPVAGFVRRLKERFGGRNQAGQDRGGVPQARRRRASAEGG